MSTIKQSPHGSFKVTQLCPNIAICEAVKGDYHNWNNGTETQPAFITYLGCNQDEVQEYIKILKTYYHCSSCEVRQPKYLSDFEAEIKIRGMQRESDDEGFGLDDLINDSMNNHCMDAKKTDAQENEIDYDEYQYYTTGVMQRW